MTASSNPLIDAFAEYDVHPDDRTVLDRIAARYSHINDNGCIILNGQADHDKRPLMRVFNRMERLARIIVALRDYIPVHETWRWDTRHLCGRAACCNPNHLTHGTRTENYADMVAHGTAPVGERHGNTKLTDEQASSVLSSNGTYAQIAERFGVSVQVIGRIKRGETWAHLPRPA